MDYPPATARSATLASHRRLVVATGVGQVIEWFDWTIYASFAPYFSVEFFPEGRFGSGLLATFGVYAIGFLFRPLGGVLLGHLADRYGRSRVFTTTVLMMAAGSLLVAVVPTYQHIGVCAPLLLLCARIVQGLSAGGEMPASAALVTEQVPAKRRGFYSSSVFVGIGIGVLLASILGWVLTSALSDGAMTGYGWRIAFGIGALLGLCGLLLRRNLRELPSGENASATREVRGPRASRIPQNPLTPAPRKGWDQVMVSLNRLFREHPKGIVRVLGFGIGATVGFYTLTVYMPTYLSHEVGMGDSTAFMVNCVVLTVYSLLLPVFGHLSDVYGRRPVAGWTSLVLAVLMVPISLLLSPSVTVTLPCLLVALVCLAGFHGPFTATMSEQFSPRLRGLGVGLAYSVVTALFGGTATFVATALSQAGHPIWFFGYVAGTFALSAGCYLTIPETSAGLRKGNGSTALVEHTSNDKEDNALTRHSAPGGRTDHGNR